MNCPDFIKEIEARLSAATPGPWFNGYWSGQCHIQHQHGNGNCKYDMSKETGGMWDCYVSTEDGAELIGSSDYGPVLSRKDARFIAHAPSDLRRLLDALKTATEALEAIAAEKCKPSFDENLPKLERAELISIVDTDTSLAREALAKLGKESGE